MSQQVPPVPPPHRLSNSSTSPSFNHQQQQQQPYQPSNNSNVNVNNQYLHQPNSPPKSTASQSRPVSASPGLIHRSVTATRDPAEIYNNAVMKPEELPMARQPKFFGITKNILLLLCLLSVLSALASLVFGVTVERKGGLLYPGLRDVPYKASTAAIFIGGFAFSVSITLLTLVYRNWHPSLLTFGLFVAMIAFSKIALTGMLSPGPNLTAEQAHNWLRIKNTGVAEQIANDFQDCCGYLNSTTCNATAAGLAEPAASTPVPAAAPAAAAKTISRRGLQKADPGSASASTDGTKLPRLQRRQAAAAPPAAAPTTTKPDPALNSPVNPLPAAPANQPVNPTDMSSPATNVSPASIGDTGFQPCQPLIDPVIYKQLSTIRTYYIIGAIISCLQLVFLGGFWTLLGRWKRSRGVARW